MQRSVTIGLLLLLFFLFVQTTTASTMQSDRYTIEKHTTKIKPYQTQTEKTKSPEEKPVKEGFNYVTNSTHMEAFAFEASSDLLDYGELSATNPVIRKLILKIAAPQSFQIFTTANHPLQTPNGHFIPDTTCDNGSCSDLTAAPWTNALTYGFGYQLETMKNSDFKQIPDLSRNEAPILLSEDGEAKKQQIPLTYKVNISGTQEEGTYSNTIFYIATPNY